MRVFVVLALIVCFAFAASPVVTKPIVAIPTAVPAVPRPKEIETSCYLQGDPHIKTPAGANFDFYDSGDYLFANFDNKVKVIGRTNTVSSWPGRSVTTAVMVIVAHKGRQIKISVHASDNALKLDHKVTELAVKKNIENKAAGVAIVRDSTNVYIVTIGTIRVSISLKNPKTPNAYIDTTIYSSKSASDRVTGLCGSKKLIQKDETAFSTKRKIHTPIPHPKKYSKEAGKKFCAKLPNAMTRHFCEADYEIGGPQLAQSSYTVEIEKKKFRQFYRLSKPCRQAIRRHQFLQRNRRFAEAAAFKPQVKKACAKKRKSPKCKHFQSLYAANVAKYNKFAAKVPAAQRAAAQSSIRVLGEQVQLACSKRAREACKVSRTTAVKRIQTQIVAAQAQLAKLARELRAAQERKCRV